MLLHRLISFACMLGAKCFEILDRGILLIGGTIVLKFSLSFCFLKLGMFFFGSHEFVSEFLFFFFFFSCTQCCYFYVKLFFSPIISPSLVILYNI
jgi:hypothetical protein